MEFNLKSMWLEEVEQERFLKAGLNETAAAFIGPSKIRYGLLIIDRAGVLDR